MQSCVSHGLDQRVPLCFRPASQTFDLLGKLPARPCISLGLLVAHCHLNSQNCPKQLGHVSNQSDACHSVITNLTTYARGLICLRHLDILRHRVKIPTSSLLATMVSWQVVSPLSPHHTTKDPIPTTRDFKSVLFFKSLAASSAAPQWDVKSQTSCCR